MRFTLGKKIVLLLIVFAIVLSGVAIAISYGVIDTMNEQHYMAKANELAATVARTIDAPKAQKLADAAQSVYDATDEKVLSDEWGSPEFNAYVGRFADIAETPEYRELLAHLHGLQEVNDVECFYIWLVVPEDKTCMYLVDAADEDPCPVGCIDPLYDFNEKVLSDSTAGFPAYITNTEEYGWLVTAGAPVRDENGKVICYAAVDISMATIKQHQAEYVFSLSIALICLTVVVSVITSLFARKFITRPLDELSSTASRYCDPKQRSLSTFEALDIHTKDEIEDLYHSMVQMERDIDGYIDNLVETRTQLVHTRQRAILLNDLAHKDALTGLRNKMAYDQEMEIIESELANGSRAFGIAIIDLNDLKGINDAYGHECGDVAIVKLSHLVCDVFSHSPVFRIGGDEFAVVLRNADYDHVAELANKFNEAVEATQKDGADGLKPWERVSAALGYALYDEERDEDAQGVFRRADRSMYERKRSMKGDRPVR